MFRLVTINNLRLQSLNAPFEFFHIRLFRTPHLTKCWHVYHRQRYISPPPIVRSLHLVCSRSTCSRSGIVGTTVVYGWRSILVAGGHGCCYDTPCCTNYGQTLLHFHVSMPQFIHAPQGARAYPWILSKYFPCVRPCVRACIRPPTDKCRVCILCVKQHLFLVF